MTNFSGFNAVFTDTDFFGESITYDGGDSINATRSENFKLQTEDGEILDIVIWSISKSDIAEPEQRKAIVASDATYYVKGDEWEEDGDFYHITTYRSERRPIL